MTLQSHFDQQLRQLGPGGPITLCVEEAKRQLSCVIVERDSLAVSFERLRLATTELASATAAELERIGKALAERLTYLMEPISPIELDEQGCLVQLRSNPPHRDEDSRTYFELLVRRGGEIDLVRYRKENGASRRLVPATITREVLLRLVGDFCTVLD
jgi:hypothetical protein